MAEAGVENSTSTRYFCHKCTVEISPQLPEYTCPRCNSGFIEVLESELDSDSDSPSEMDEDFVEAFQSELAAAVSAHAGSANSSSGSGSSGAASSSSSSGSYRPRRYRQALMPRHGRRRVTHERLAPFLQDFLLHLTSEAMNGVDGEAEMLPRRYQMIGAPVFMSNYVTLNPGDYAWGRNGLDGIITQLMNQFDGSGPPPLSQEKIDLIPMVAVTQEQCEKCLQCSVCMEDFKMSESVRKLMCGHQYHNDCIIPWLQLHGTCPVCRKIVTLCETTEFSDSTGMTNDSGNGTPAGNTDRQRNPQITEEELD